MPIYTPIMRGAVQRLPAYAAAAAIAVSATSRASAAQDAPPAVAPLPAATAADATPPQPESAIARRARARDEAEQALRKSIIPRPIDKTKFTALLTAASPVLATNAELLQAHAGYLEAIEKQNETALRQMLRMLPAAFRYDAATLQYEPRPTPELVALLALREKAERNAMTAERKLLDAVESALPAERRTAYSKALLALRLERMQGEARLPSTSITLIELIPEARLGAETEAVLDEQLGAYAQSLERAIRARSELLQQNASARAMTETIAGALWRYAPEMFVAETERKLDQLDDLDFASELAIRDLHFDALKRLRARVGPKEGRKLVELWQRALHPELFDDERLLSRIAEETLAHPSFSADHDTALLDSLETAYQRLEPLSRAACEAADQILPRLADRSKAAMEAEIDARLDLIRAQNKRRTIVKESLQRIRLMLGDSDPALTGRIDDILGSVDSLTRADSFEEKTLTVRRGALADTPSSSAVPAGPNGGLQAPQGDVPASGKGTESQPNGATSGGSADKSADDASRRNGRGGRGNRRNQDD